MLRAYDKIRHGILGILDLWNSDRKRSVKYLLFFALWQIVSMALCVVARKLLPGYGVYDFVGAVTGNLFFQKVGCCLYRWVQCCTFVEIEESSRPFYTRLFPSACSLPLRQVD